MAEAAQSVPETPGRRACNSWPRSRCGRDPLYGRPGQTLLFCAAGVSLFASSVALLKPRKTNDLAVTLLTLLVVALALYGVLSEAGPTSTSSASSGGSAQTGCDSSPVISPTTSYGGEDQIDGGNIFHVITGPGEISSNIVLAHSPSVLTLSVFLYDPGPYGVESPLVTVPLPTRPTDCWYLTVRTFSESASPSSTTATLVINVADGRRSRLSYVPGSTVLYNTLGRKTPLPDGITEGGVYVAQGLGRGDKNALFVNFKVRLAPAG